MINNVYIFDCEVTRFDWLFVFKEKATGIYTEVHNDAESLMEFMERKPLLAGFNNKHYDQFILKAALLKLPPEEIFAISNYIINGSDDVDDDENDKHTGWEIPALRNCPFRFDQYDLKDDCQNGLSLKAIEAHLGMDIRETTVSFDVDHPLTQAELEEMFFYCRHDVDATDKLDDLRQDYLLNKIALGKTKGLSETRSLYMTNAKLTAAYLDARPPEVHYKDEREYKIPNVILKEYIPAEVLKFFEDIHDMSIPSEIYFKRKLNIMVGECPVTLAFGGIHGAIPKYKEVATDTRTIRNKDVASYYPHQMTLNHYCSRNIPSPKVYEDTIEERVKAKKSGDKSTANALKLVLNTTYGAMLNKHNDLYDPLMGRSVCISGQLQLLELAFHCLAECPTLKVIQVNTDGIMVSLDNTDEAKWQEITRGWETRTGFELEEDFIQTIVQKDVNNYVEIAVDGKAKLKGGVLVRGIAPAGAFNINNNAVVIARAVAENLAHDIPVAETVNACEKMLDFQIVAKSWAKCGNAWHSIGGHLTEVQRVNRVYATPDWQYGRLYMIDPDTGNYRQMSGLPARCIIDNDNSKSIDMVDRQWYISEAQRLVNEFRGIPPVKRNTRKINTIKRNILKEIINGK